MGALLDIFRIVAFTQSEKEAIRGFLIGEDRILSHFKVIITLTAELRIDWGGSHSGEDALGGCRRGGGEKFSLSHFLVN